MDDNNFEKLKTSNEVVTGPTKWDTLEDTPFAGEQDSDESEELDFPGAEELAALQKELEQAEYNGDAVEIERIKNDMLMVIAENRDKITPEQEKIIMEQYPFLLGETTEKIADSENQGEFMTMAKDWRKMGEDEMPEQPEQLQLYQDPEKDKQIKATVEGIEKTVEKESGDTKVAEGEASSIYQIEKSDGKTTTQVKSDYYDDVDRLIRAYPGVEQNLELSSAMNGLATSLALVDAMRGKNLTGTGTEQAEKLLKDYGTLVTMLKDPNTSAENKQAINECFKKLDGDALRMMRERYNGPDDLPEEDLEQESEQKNEQELNEAQRVEVEQQLGAAKADLEILRSRLDENYYYFDKAFSDVDELIQSGEAVKDIEMLERKLIELKRAHEELEAIARKFALNNSNYDLDLVNGSKNLPRERFNEERSYVSRNDERVTEIARAVRGVEERILGVQQLVTSLRNSNGF
ncbi:hypothetical protein J5491_01160 [Candidatus Saccharibacteria bacterium]|nr:hypothetical protein [Candidatus Saccharibacteria bacterium]